MEDFATNYRFCPECGSPLEMQVRHGRARPVCGACGTVIFIEPKVAVVALLTSGPWVLLIRRGAGPERGKWALPGGFMDADEVPDLALRREVREETGLDVEVGALLEIYPLTNASGQQVGVVLAYAATASGDERAQAAAGDDVLEAVWWRADELTVRDQTAVQRFAGDFPIDIAFESTRRLLAAWVRQWQAGDRSFGP